MLRIEFAEAASIVDGLAHNEHGGEGEVVVVNYLGEILQNASIDLLVWPGEMITGSNRGVLWVFLKQFALHIIDDGGCEEDAHR